MSDRPVFVVGCPRSGTTMLQLMLHAHPRMAVPPETRFVEYAYYRRRNLGDMRDPANRRALAKRITVGKGTRFHDLGIDADEYIRRAVTGPGSLGSVIGLAFQMYAERFGKDRWGDKRPSYVRKVHLLRRLFPDAQFVHLIRDGRDCVASLKEMPWYRLDSFHAASAWAEAMDAGKRLRRSLPEDSYYELRYEDLTGDPALELKKLCHFLGEEFDPAMCKPYTVAGVAVPTHKTWHSNTHSEVTRARVGSWATRLEDWEIALCEGVLGELLREQGYELSGAPRPAKEHVEAFRQTLSKRRKHRLRKRLKDRWDQLREPGPVACLLTSGQHELARVS
ncbi:sulfotransferase family protein [Thermoactinospora rubra]|uniref:sulfotransferase family protein n=1 Tax=Thermoactinospora rubra TaxID=1088767 RepID=UPI000A11B9D5|nr:sulfotransferase [Thermoactinospora rubra]